SIEIPEPILPSRDLLFPFPFGQFRFDQTEVGDAFHELGKGRFAPAQFARDIEPQIKIVARIFRPELKRLPRVKAATVADPAEIAFHELPKARRGMKRLHRAKKCGFGVAKFAPEMCDEAVVK